MFSSSDSDLTLVSRSGASAPTPRARYLQEAALFERPAKGATGLLRAGSQPTAEAVVGVLRQAGITVKRVAPAGGALRVGRASPFKRLELALLDGPELDLLQGSRTAVASTLVPVVTDFAEAHLGLTAAGLQAIAFKCQFVLWRDSVENVPGLVDGSRYETPRQFASDDNNAGVTASSLLGETDVFDSSTTFGRPLQHPTVTFITFLTCAALLRRLVLTPAAFRCVSAADETDRGVTRTSLQIRYAERAHATAAVEVLGWALVRSVRRSLGGIARELGIDPEKSRYDLEVVTGGAFPLWRSAAAIMLGAGQLAGSPEQVSQIAYRLAFNHHSQFDRESNRLLGASPRPFRMPVMWTAQAG